MGSFPLAQSPRSFSRIAAFVGKFRWESPAFYRHNSGERSIKKERKKCTESPKINWRAHTQWSVRIRSRKSALSDANVTGRSLVGTIACDHRDSLLFTAIYFQSLPRFQRLQLLSEMRINTRRVSLFSMCCSSYYTFYVLFTDARLSRWLEEYYYRY